MPVKTSRRFVLLVVGGLGSVILLGVLGGTALLRTSPVGPAKKAGLPSQDVRVAPVARPKPVSQAGYLGSEACKACHAEICQTYLGHPMARSAAVIPGPNDGEDYSVLNAEFSGKRGLRYRVEATGSQIIHHETAVDDDGEVRYEQGMPVSLVIGAGVRGKSYAANYDGILLQSPISWYAAHNGYFQLSPGYEKSNLHFNRRWSDDCLTCHLGRTELDAEGKFNFKELTIGCERCHGPGENHVTRQNAKSSSSPDSSIVNPARLTVRERESVCYDCHLQGAFRTTRYGRRARDFRPGMALEDVTCVLIKPLSRSNSTAIVSQVEQMWISRCFLQSRGELGCTSCHDPHRQPAPEAKADFYRSRCLQCHSNPGCSLPVAQRAANQDSCVECHMPSTRSSTVAHISQTDRIRREQREPEETQVSPAADEELQFFDRAFERLPQWEVQRVLGLNLANHSKGSIEEVHEALAILVPLVQIAPDDAEILQAIGILSMRLGKFADARAWFERAAGAEPNNEYVLSNLAAACLRTNDSRAALKHANRCIELNPRTANHFLLQAAALAGIGKREEAAAAARQALELDRSLTGNRSVETFLDANPRN